MDHVANVESVDTRSIDVRAGRRRRRRVEDVAVVVGGAGLGGSTSGAALVGDDVVAGGRGRSSGTILVPAVRRRGGIAWVGHNRKPGGRILLCEGYNTVLLEQRL